MLLSDLNIYKDFVGLMLPGEDFSNIHISNGELILSVDNKKIVLDSLTESNMGWLNIEGQSEEDDFPFSRQLYYWARVYSNQIK
ncbi:MAG: PD-(D/E)XK nuclease family transposase [Clostridiales bacterium]|jgi:predicted transposase/invertase (TIGR01784 family)|nr:PD-(D/E)XK nuclease family transposase [Clostridiales bacterium]